MEITTLCAVVAALRVDPDRSQFFQYESVSLSCGGPGAPPDWRVRKNTSTSGDQDCSEGPDPSCCHIDDLFPLDSGTYWCESAGGRRGEAVDIFVTGRHVTLESPVLPVAEGDHVTLRCRTSATSSSDVSANFYKDGLLIASSPTSNITVHAVSKEDEGLYACNISGDGWSAASRLTVRGRPEPPAPTLVHPEVGGCLSLLVVLVVLVVVLVVVVLVVLCLWRSCKGEELSYTDVPVTRGDRPPAAPTDDSSFYSMLMMTNA
ncbi:low affinity immunoglobulin gamma Fc region receptor II-like isoform X2 [Pungitius pungitius]|uniref:low affinity immunoglobulin gamma Fc region receptor II-like isoform X2 n=1 Tax=Pungitius pungitius TaxID=134920 RepID=UPI002E103176